MGRYSDWAKEDLWDKMDWEGGIEGILEWGGPYVFEVLGPQAVRLATEAKDALRGLQVIIDAAYDEREEM